MSDVLLVEREENLATLTLNRPEAGNSFNRELLGALAAAVRAIEEDGDVRAVVVTGAGDKVFCAGADLKERATMTSGEVRMTVSLIRDTLTAVAHLPMPVVAAINGHALGGGLELALASDIRVASRWAELGLTETSLGIIPGGGGTQRLPRLIGPGRAKWMILSGQRVSKDEAQKIGIVDHLAENADAARALAHDIAARIAMNAPIAVRAAKEAIDRGAEMPLEHALHLETSLYERTLETKDRLEGLAAFREKRRPVYRGE